MNMLGQEFESSLPDLARRSFTASVRLRWPKSVGGIFIHLRALSGYKCANVA